MTTHSEMLASSVCFDVFTAMNLRPTGIAAEVGQTDLTSTFQKLPDFGGRNGKTDALQGGRGCVYPYHMALRIE